MLADSTDPLLGSIVYIKSGTDIGISPEHFSSCLERLRPDFTFVLAQGAYDAIPVVTESGKWIFCTL